MRGWDAGRSPSWGGGGAAGDGLDFCRADVAAVYAVAADRPCPAARSCLACADHITADTGIDLPFHARTARPRLQSDFALDRANPNVVQPAAQRRIGPVMQINAIPKGLS